MTLTEAIDNGLPLMSLFQGTSVEKLTVKQLRQAAMDLHEAAFLLAETGHHKGELIESRSGHMCCLGAIEAATYKKVARAAGTWVLLARDSDDLDGMIYRASNAIAALAGTVRHLCECENPEGSDEWAVCHYNDVHCTGGIVAYNMLRIAAARALVLAETKADLIEKVLA